MKDLKNRSKLGKNGKLKLLKFQDQKTEIGLINRSITTLFTDSLLLDSESEEEEESILSIFTEDLDKLLLFFGPRFRLSAYLYQEPPPSSLSSPPDCNVFFSIFEKVWEGLSDLDWTLIIFFPKESSFVLKKFFLKSK